jgi:VWFA-related protein
MSRRSLLIGIAARMLAQEPATFSTGVKVVSLFATVRDKDGRAVKGLRQDDFLLLEDGAPQTIRYFSRESGLPLTLGLLIDTSRSQEGVLGSERQASKVFLERMLREDLDQALIVHFDERVETLQPLTSSRRELASSLDRLRVPGNYATLIYSAIRDTAENAMRLQTGRKAFILLTDGVAFRDHTSIETAIEFAQRADTIIYPIRFADNIKLYRPGKAAVLAAASEKGKQGLKRLANETGGVSYEVSKSRAIADIYSEIEDALRNQYSIGYTPERPGGDGKYRKVKLTVKDRGLIVNTRDGYYAK